MERWAFLRYRLDDLGWYSFERLVQSLLKAEIGIGIENWSGNRDRGRDGYCQKPLHFPERNVLSPGPFVFQVKHVRGANAAGAKPAGPILAAVKSEITAINQRITNGEWKLPGSYVLLTNAPLSAGCKDKIERLFRDVLPATEVSSLDGSDICDFLDKLPEIRKSHPEILGLSDLFELIREAVGNPIFERSAAAIQEAEQISKVFVQTRAYRKTQENLSKHGFVVLDGPPEMGKTSIARMIALDKVLEKWTAIECRSPDDFFAAYSQSTQQIFIADDAFGRTEFDFTLSRQWERDLPRILNLTDGRHWLVWTSRKHILARAISSMDLTNSAANFPLPSEVTVDAAALSIEEKARMLYRHAKREELEEDVAAVIQKHAARIVESKFFTPERIRRFVRESLPDFIRSSSGVLTKSGKLGTLIDKAIQSPTLRMRKAFKGLPNEHRDLLIDMLECGRYCTLGKLSSAFTRRHGAITEISLRVAVEDLVGTFLKRSPYGSLDWIHPSYRDVVIDAISDDAELQVVFLRTASVQGLQLAFSTKGGESGSRNWPFLRCAASWEAASMRLASLVRGPTLPDVLEIARSILLRRSQISAFSETHATRLVGEILDSLCNSFNSNRRVQTREIESLFSIFSVEDLPPRFNFLPVNDLPPQALQLSPYLRSRLKTIESELGTSLKINSYLVQEIVALVNWVQRFEPRGLFDPSIRSVLDPILEVVYEYATQQCTASFDNDLDHYEDRTECERLSALFRSINYGDIERAEEMANMLDEKWLEYYLEDREQEDYFEDEDESLDKSKPEPFDISAVFEDL
jgi:Novel STAND NTPase 3